MRVRTGSPKETQLAGFQFALDLDFPAVVGLYGPLGSGKTCFVQGAAEALALPGPVNSPTYSLINIYPGTRTICHMDAYRLRTAEEVLQTGVEEYFGNSLCFIEWAERIEPFLPDNTVRISFRIVDEKARDISFS